MISGLPLESRKIIYLYFHLYLNIIIRYLNTDHNQVERYVGSVVCKYYKWFCNH